MDSEFGCIKSILGGTRGRAKSIVSTVLSRGGSESLSSSTKPNGDISSVPAFDGHNSADNTCLDRSALGPTSDITSTGNNRPAFGCGGDFTSAIAKSNVPTCGDGTSSFSTKENGDISSVPTFSLDGHNSVDNGSSDRPAFGHRGGFTSAANDRPSFGRGGSANTSAGDRPGFGRGGSVNFSTGNRPAFGHGGSIHFSTGERPAFGRGGGFASTTNDRPGFGRDGSVNSSTGDRPAFGRGGSMNSYTGDRPAFGRGGSVNYSTGDRPAFGCGGNFTSTTNDRPGFGRGGSMNSSTGDRPAFGRGGGFAPATNDRPAFGRGGSVNSSTNDRPAFGSNNRSTNHAFGRGGPGTNRGRGSGQSFMSNRSNFDGNNNNGQSRTFGERLRGFPSLENQRDGRSDSENRPFGSKPFGNNNNRRFGSGSTGFGQISGVGSDSVFDAADSKHGREFHGNRQFQTERDPDEYATFGLGTEPDDFVLAARTVEQAFADDSKNAEKYRMVVDDDEDIVLNEDHKDISVTYQSASILALDSWADAKFEKLLYDNIAKAQYIRPRKIQAHSIPMIMEGHDLKAHAETGSGKTVAFMAPIINMLMKSKDTREKVRCPTPLALVIEPARELCLQVWSQGCKLADGTGLAVKFAYGEYPCDKNYSELEMGCDILCATPGRLISFALGPRRVDLSYVRYLVLDEADRLLDGSFMPQLHKIIIVSPHFPKNEARQTMLFSATFPEEVQRFANDVLKPNNMFLSLKNRTTIAANSKIIQNFFLVENNQKKTLLMEILRGTTKLEVPKNVDRTLIFVNSKRSADLLAIYLSQEGLKATTINADRSQKQRELALSMFRDNDIKILVSTDVCARGIDVNEMDHVINFDLPNDPVVYVHRIGRTGRLCGGFATSFFDEFSDKDLVPDLVKIMREAGQDPPMFMKEMLNVIDHPRADDAISMWNRPSECGFVTKSLCDVTKDDNNNKENLNGASVSSSRIGVYGFSTMPTIEDTAEEWIDDDPPELQTTLPNNH